jgi:hypothetical protein
VVKHGDRIVDLRYTPEGAALSYGIEASSERLGKAKWENCCISIPGSRARVSKFVYLSHVIAQCGLREKAIRPLWRLLRVGYTIRYSNFKRLVKSITTACNQLADFTRDLTAPAKGLQLIPTLCRMQGPLVVRGISVPRWTLRRHYVYDYRDEILD